MFPLDLIYKTIQTLCNTREIMNNEYKLTKFVQAAG